MTDLHVQTVGPADAAVSLLFMHGGMGLDHTYFRPFVNPLADRAQLVFFDHRLAGRSPRTRSAPVDLATMTRDALAVAGETCTGAVIPIGHSFSALVALSMAVTEPSAIQGLICVGHALSTTIGATLLGYAAERGTAAQQQALTRAFACELTSDDEYAAAWQEVLPLYFHRFTEDSRRVLGRVSFSVTAFNEFLQHGFGRIDYVKELPRLRVPVLFIGGESDWCERDPGGGSPGAARLARDGRAIVIPESGHFPFAEQPDRFNAAIASWLDESLPTLARSAL